MSGRVQRELAKAREIVEDNRAALRFLIGIELRKKGVRGWRKRARMIDGLVADRRAGNSHGLPGDTE